MERGLGNEGLDLDEVEEVGDRYQLDEVLGSGVNATVYSATDSQSGQKVAIKIVRVTGETKDNVEEEYKILRDLSDHPNLPDFYGVYKKSEQGKLYVWFVMQLCDGGPVTDLIHALLRNNKKMSEMHIAFIIKEVLKALLKLHENHVIHRDIKGSNILLTKNGEIKLVDFGISRELSSSLGRCHTAIGSPSWMAPEVVLSKNNKTSYDNRADVWALGITTIELGDGKAPYQDMHPTRALFQIVRNPPPTLYRPANWSQTYNDFIAECLEKNPDHRPYMTELIEHPFLQELPENDFHLNAELKSLLETVTKDDIAERKPEVGLRKGCLKKGASLDPEPMYLEDLAGLDHTNEDNIVQQLEARFAKDKCFTFVGDILLFLNPYKPLDIFGYQHYCKYKFKSRSDNEPHIFAVADGAYQDMLHHDVPQNIVITGETMSGKTQQFNLLIRHLSFLGMCGNNVGDKIQKAVDILQAFGNAATPYNSNSTRHALLTQVTYSTSGRISGAIFWLYQLEKWRVTGNRSPYHANFHIFYYFYDGISAEGTLEDYLLEKEKNYCYLRRAIHEEDVDIKAPLGPREKAENNPAIFKKIKDHFIALGFEESELEIIWRVLAAILHLGEVEYKEDDDRNADIKDTSVVDKVASLLDVDGKKLAWALCNYCVVEKDTAARRKHSRPEALAARNVLAQTLYSRLTDWIVNMINYKLSFSRTIYGDHHYISILDLFGFECYQENSLEQLFVNSLNEQLQYYYVQRVFISEMQEEEEEEMELKKFQFYDNKDTMDELLNKPHGIMHILDEANKLNLDSDYVIDSLDKKSEGSHVRSCGEDQFSVAHYTGKITYEVASMVSKNRDFLPPELTEVLRFSRNSNIKQLFTNKLNRTGNVTINVENVPIAAQTTQKKRWGAALCNESNRRARSYNTASKGEFSQTKGIRTASATFRSVSLELLRVLAAGSTHFVRCLRTDLNGNPESFQQNIIRQQLRAMSVIDTAKARQSGYSHRVTFSQFLQRYKFLSFDFDETVDETRDNCRLLLIRLKLEGWHLGKTKVFLKYYNEEYLSRMYENQVKKIIKVQSMLRSFLAKRNVATKKQLKSTPSFPETATQQNVCSGKLEMSHNDAAVVIQKNIKGYVARKKYGPLINVSSGKLDEDTVLFIKGYFNRWRARSIFQVLILYRAAKYQEFIYFCQQVHLYNQNVVSSLRSIQKEKVNLKNIDKTSDPRTYVGEETPSVWKIPFRIKDFPFCDSSHLQNSVAIRITNDEDLPWDNSFKTLDKGCQTTFHSGDEPFHTTKKKKERYNNFISTPYCRDPKVAEAKYKEQTYKYIDDDGVEDEIEKSFRQCFSPENQHISPYIEHPRGTNQRTPVKMNMSPGFDKANYSSYQTRHMSPVHSYQQPIRPSSPYREKIKENKPNPIAELELKGKRIPKSDSADEDEPPFNFQAMLRKTNHNRKSLKRQAPEPPVHINRQTNNFSNGSFQRTKDFQNNNEVLWEETGNQNLKSQTRFNYNQNGYGSNLPPKQVEKQKPYNRRDSGRTNNKVGARELEKDKYNQRGITDNGILLEENEYNSIRTEILPGLVIIGSPTIDL